MSTCDSPIPASSMRVVDVSGQSLAKVSQLSKYTSAAKHNVAAIIADGNNLMTLQGIQHYPALIQLSARDNSLVRMESVSALTNLVTLNLQNNSLTEIAGLTNLVHLQWVCLSGNSIRALDGLSANIQLSHLDLSDNCITELTDISMLNVLKTFLLHGNAISSLLRAGHLVPASVETLSLAENDMEDLTQISSLSLLKLLTQLSLMNNPCVSITDTQLFDSRPYVLHCCPNLTVLDGVEVTSQERYLSESLFPPNQPHPFSIGQHNLLVQYLSSTNPLSSTQVLMSTPMGRMYPENQENINPNNLSTLSSITVSSLAELEEMIKGTHSSEKSSQSDLLQKLKALQLIEQMISTQEQLLSGHQGDDKQSQPTHLALSRAGNDALPVHMSTYSQQESAEQVLPSHFLSIPTMVAPTDDADVVTPDLSVRGHGILADVDSMEEMSDLSQCRGFDWTTHGQLNGHCPAEIKTRSHDSRASNWLSLKEKREEELRLLNEKIAQRHSKLPRKTDSTNKTAQALSTSVSKKTNPSAQKQDPSRTKLTSAKARPSGREKKRTRKAKGTAKVAGKPVLSSKSAPTLHGSKSVTSSSVPSHVPLSRDPPSHAPPTSHVPPSSSKAINQSTTSPKIQHQLNSPQFKSLDISEQNMYNPSDDVIPLESFSSSQLQLVEIEETMAADNSDMLDSTSYLIPVEGDGDETVVADTSTMTEDGVQMHSTSSTDMKKTDMTREDNSLASTLTQAYGFSTTSDLLSTLTSPHKERFESTEDCSANSTMKRSGNLSTIQSSLLPLGTSYTSTMTAHKAATVIQAAWRGFRARKREQEIARVYRELNTTKLETCVATMYSQLQIYREELVHQASVVQRQEETIQSLTNEVELLLNWKTKSETLAKIKAATIIQKHWRGYATRKCYPRICHGLVPRSLAAMWAALHSLTKQVEEMSVTLSSAQDVCGTREKFQSKDFPEVHLPPPTDVQLIHFSSTCVLLHWTPAVPTGFGGVILQGYRVYVNGMPEGMVGPAKSKAYIEGLDPKTTYRIMVRAMYNAGESCDSNPIIASLDARSGKTVQMSTDDTAHVHTEQSHNSDGGGENSVTAEAIQQTDRDNSPSREPLKSSPATKPGASPIVQTETHCEEVGEFLPPEPEQNNSGPREGHSLSHSATSDQVVNSSAVDAQSPTAGSESHSPSPTTSHTEIDEDSQHSGTGDGGENNENEAQLPPDFDGTHLFQLVPKAHHITDETVSVMSNATEEYIGGSSSRETISHDRSLTSMIFGARESGDSTSDQSSLSDSGCSESGDKEAKKVDRDVEQIQKSYLSQLPPQSSHASTSQEREDKREPQKTEDGVQLRCLQADCIPIHHSVSHNGMINRDIPSALPNMTHVNDSPSAALNTTCTAVPSTFGILTPYPSPFLFDGVLGAGSKRMPRPLHPLSNVQLQGEIQGLALTTTTTLTHDPDSLTTSLGSTLQADTDDDDTLTRNKAPGHPKEIQPEKFSEVAIAGGSDVSHTQSCGTIRENNELSPLSCPSMRPSQACQVVSGEQTTEHTITCGSQTTPGAVHVANITQQSNLLLLGSAVQRVPSEIVGSGAPNNDYGIPKRVTGDFERDRNFEGKPFNENLESDASSKREDSEAKRNGGMNKSNLEMAIERAGVKVELPSQLVEGFDLLQSSEKLPSVATNSNLIGSLRETKTSQSMACTGMGGVPSASTSQPLANKPQIVVSGEQQSPSDATGASLESETGTYKTMDTPNAGSSTLLASLLLSQLESDLNTA